MFVNKNTIYIIAFMFLKIILKKTLYVILDPLIWPNLNPEDHDFDKLESTLYAVAFQ